MLALASRGLVEILRGVLGGDHTDFKHQVFAGGPDSSDGPPLEKGPDPNPVKLGNPTRHDLAGNSLGIRGQVVVWRESDFARTAEIDVEVAGSLVYGVAPNGGW